MSQESSEMAALIEKARNGKEVLCPRPNCWRVLKVRRDAATGHTAGICLKHGIIWQE